MVLMCSVSLKFSSSSTRNCEHLCMLYIISAVRCLFERKQADYILVSLKVSIAIVSAIIINHCNTIHYNLETRVNQLNFYLK